MIYFIQQGEDGPVKVGHSYTEQVGKRMSNLQTSNPCELRLLTTMPGSTDREKWIHRLLADHHIRGEWFHPAPLVLAMATGSHPEIVYELDGDRPCMVYFRGHRCWFCGKVHYHGLPDGHRVVHCVDHYASDHVVAPDGTVLLRNSGYLVRTPREAQRQAA